LHYITQKIFDTAKKPIEEYEVISVTREQSKLNAYAMKILFTFLIAVSLLLRSHLSAEGMGGCEIPPAVDRLLDCFAEEQRKSRYLVLVAKNAEEGYCCDECPQELGTVDGYEDFGTDFVEKPWCIEDIEDFCSGMEFDVPSGIVQIGLMFDYFGEVDIAAARRLITSVVDSLVDRINKDKKMAPYFLCYPISINQISVRIRIRRDECGFYYPPLGNVAYISAIDGMIYYGTLNSYTYEIDNLRTEPYPLPKPVAALPPPLPSSPRPLIPSLPKPAKPIPRRSVPHVPVRKPYNAPRSSGGGGY
jgi:hypothetical protein